jgi:hypothetical protein
MVRREHYALIQLNEVKLLSSLSESHLSAFFCRIEGLLDAIFQTVFYVAFAHEVWVLQNLWTQESLPLDLRQSILVVCPKLCLVPAASECTHVGVQRSISRWHANTGFGHLHDLLSQPLAETFLDR